MAVSERLSAARRFRLFTTIGILAAAITVITAAGDQRPHEWRDYGGGPDNSKFSTLKQINKSNVSRLEVAWTYEYGETMFNPIVTRGVIYGKGRNSSLVALDAGTGKEIWIHEGLEGITRRGMNYWESKDGKDRRLLFSIGDYLQEIDATTGKSIVTFGQDGVVDLRKDLGRDPEKIGRIQSNTPGKVFENLLILGSATGEAYFSPPGDLRAYDIVTGKLVWTFHTVPHPGEFGYDTWPRTHGSTSAARTRGGRSLLMPSGASRSSRPGRRRSISTAPTGTERISLPTACSRWTRAPANVSGTSRTCITISGTTTILRRLS